MHCGAVAGTVSNDCSHAKTTRVELTPTVKRALTQLRSARSYLRYLTERFGEMVQIEHLAQAESSETAASRRGRKSAVVTSDVPAVPEIDDRQVSLFG